MLECFREQRFIILTFIKRMVITIVVLAQSSHVNKYSVANMQISFHSIKIGLAPNLSTRESMKPIEYSLN